MPLPDTQPLVIYHDLEPFREESLIQLPLHLTIIPFFEPYHVSRETILRIVGDICDEVGPIPLEPGEEDLYGPMRDVPITKMEDTTGELTRLHGRLINSLGNAGCRFTNLTYALENYSPHITHSSPRMRPQPFVIDSLSVVVRQELNSENPREVLRTISLG